MIIGIVLYTLCFMFYSEFYKSNPFVLRLMSGRLVKNQYDQQSAQQAGKLIVSMPFCFAKASNPFATLKLDIKTPIFSII